MAAAEAETGTFDDAIKLVTQAQALGDSARDAALVEQCKKVRASLEAGTPYRELQAYAKK